MLESHHQEEAHEMEASQQWEQRWRVVTSSKTKLHASLLFHGWQLISSIIFAAAIYTNAVFRTPVANTPHSDPTTPQSYTLYHINSFCVLRYKSITSIYGDDSACSSPISLAALSAVVALGLLAMDYRTYKRQSSAAPSRRATLIRLVVCLVLAICVLAAATNLMASVAKTCSYLYTKNIQDTTCGAPWTRTYGKSLGVLDFGMVVGFVTSLVWFGAAAHQGHVFRTKERL
ncbi:hypothetical protein HKX48_002571 [Thoreauomyces humboldtii]|nr:hypothetical protein HKX48_002571 [Thoreauomyces humboldtii]